MMDRSQNRPPTVYIPCMSDHAHTVAAAMRHHGVDAAVLPPSDHETLALGLSLCRGRECLPCFLCTGDMLRACRAPGFDTSRAVFFMPRGPGPCRFGQYNVLQKNILAEEGFPEVKIVSPTTDDSYALFGDDPTAMRKLAWQAIVAVDLLTRVLHEHRPYETVPGSADAAYRASLDDLVAAMEAGGEEAAVEALRGVSGRFGSLALGPRDRPLVVVIGELYLMLNAQSNGEIVRAVEEAGGEVLRGTFMDWLYFVDWCRKDLSMRFGRYREWVKATVSDLYQHSIERRFSRPLGSVLRHPPEAPVAKAVRRLEGFYDPVLGTEAVLTMARCLDLARHGVAGVINVLPFSCMPGTVVACMAPRLREEMNGIPWLDVAFDGQEETNLHTRLEAFMHQALQYHRRVLRAAS
jgi:predicted nucleotide-binding protein (sugar kinase/HSP70/actin superfamily)